MTGGAAGAGGQGARRFPALDTPVLSVTSENQFGVDTSGFIFANNTCTASGGSGSYAYTWIINSPANGAWTVNAGQSTPTAQMKVLGVGTSVAATASIVCRVTDTVTGLTADSAAAPYSYTNIHVP